MQDWSTFLSTEAQLRKTSCVKRVLPPNTLVLSKSLPPKSCFPLKGISLTFDSPTLGEIVATKTSESPDFHNCLHLVPSTGIPSFNSFIQSYIKKYHNPTFPYNTIIQAGSTHSLDSIIRTIMDPNEDTILADEITFSAFLETCEPLRIKVFGIKMTPNGLDTDHLDQVLTNWDVNESTKNFKKPKVYYAIPTGHNPTGITMPLEKRKQLLFVCKKHNLLVIEDDVFYHLHLHGDAPPSLLSLDDDGRVLRIDSFSKMLMPGTRVSTVTCNDTFYKKLIELNDFSIVSASGPSQFIISSIFNEWGEKGFNDWIIHLNDIYKAKRDTFLFHINKLIPKNLIAFNASQSGMVMWFYLINEAWPEKKENWNVYLEDLIFDKTLEYGIAIGKGHWFLVDKTTELSAWRVAYSYLELEQMETAAQIFADVLNDVHKKIYSV